MKKIQLSILAAVVVMCLPHQAQAQKHHSHGDNSSYTHPTMQKQAVQWNANFEIENDAVSEITSHVFNAIPSLAGSVLQFDSSIESPAATHYHFYQVINGQRVFGTDVVATVDLSNKVRMITANVYPTDLATGSPLTENGDLLSNDDFRTAASRGIWFYNGQTLIPAIRAVIIDNPMYEERVFDASGAMIWSHDMNLYVDTTIQVSVFNPDPLTTFQTTYTGSYKDFNDQNGSVLNPAKVDKSILATYSGGVFRLQNNWVKIDNFDAPTYSAVTQSSDYFNYSRSDYQFEQVNAYYHMTAFQLHMQDLGFTLVNYQLPVDANALSGADNSRFSTAFNPPNIAFGEGGVDDAEDADVVIHEYGHAISFSASPNSNSGTERGCLDEALGDYLAASYSRNISSYGYTRIFTWDGHNEYWSGRSGTSFKNYQNINFTGIYANTDIWVSALMEIWGNLGRDMTDELVLQSLYGYTSGMSMQDAAYLVVDADSLLYGGAHFGPIWRAFVNRGILPSHPASINESGVNSPVQFYNTQEFATGGNVDVRISNSRSYSFRLIDLSGREISTGRIPSGSERWTYSGYGLPSGAYMMILTDDEGSIYREKLVRVK